jgi:hypothetical protein
MSNLGISNFGISNAPVTGLLVFALGAVVASTMMDVLKVLLLREAGIRLAADPAAER